MTHAPSLASPVKERYGFPQATTMPMDSQPPLQASRAVMVTPIAQMWKLRRRQMRAGTLGPVLHPRGLFFSVTCGRGLLEVPDIYLAIDPSLSQRHNHLHWHPQSTQLSHSLHPNPPPKPWPSIHPSHRHGPSKHLPHSRHCAGGQPCGE